MKIYGMLTKQFLRGNLRHEMAILEKKKGLKTTSVSTLRNQKKKQNKESKQKINTEVNMKQKKNSKTKQKKNQKLSL